MATMLISTAPDENRVWAVRGRVSVQGREPRAGGPYLVHVRSAAGGDFKASEYGKVVLPFTCCAGWTACSSRRKRGDLPGPQPREDWKVFGRTRTPSLSGS
ncbi:hypothetical protein GCM10010372_43910 [Streptomyces tauricus]|nr:hypothetical protein GCM10010372_43910 [Streptomyces tauricus]